MDANIAELARKLGQAIAASNQAQTLAKVRKELDAQPQIMRTLEEFHQHSDKLAALEAQNKPIEVDDKRKLQQLHTQLVSSDVFKRYTAAQVEYVEMMHKVSETLRGQLTGVEGQ